MSETSNEHSSGALAPVKTPIRAGAQPLAIVPQTMDEVYRLAKAVVAADMTPYGINTPEKAMIAIMHGLEIGLKPMMALQRIAVVNGRPTIWGDAAIGLVRASGKSEYIKEWIEGDGDSRTAYCVTKRKDDPEPITGEFSVAAAKTAKLWGKTGAKGPTPWVTHPDRMLKMRARGFALRDAYADVLGGLYIREEIEEDEAPQRIDDEPAPAPVPTAIAAIEHKRQGPPIIVTSGPHDFAKPAEMIWNDDPAAKASSEFSVGENEPAPVLAS